VTTETPSGSEFWPECGAPVSKSGSTQKFHTPEFKYKAHEHEASAAGRAGSVRAIPLRQVVLDTLDAMPRRIDTQIFRSGNRLKRLCG
jgi:hypothetical protein